MSVLTSFQNDPYTLLNYANSQYSGKEKGKEEEKNTSFLMDWRSFLSQWTVIFGLAAETKGQTFCRILAFILPVEQWIMQQ